MPGSFHRFIDLTLHLICQVIQLICSSLTEITRHTDDALPRSLTAVRGREQRDSGSNDGTEHNARYEIEELLVVLVLHRFLPQLTDDRARAELLR